MFNYKPMCEICGKKEAISFSLFYRGGTNKFVDDDLKEFGEWKFICDCTDDEARYILIKDFFKSPDETVDWMAHTHEKYWINWDRFMDMMRRFRNTVRGYNQN